jgi:hypothetical protein
MLYALTPEQRSLLALAHTTWDRRALAKKHRLILGEESITDTMLLDLADSFPGRVTIVPFNKRQEGKFGADWAWAFRSADGRQNLPMLVQAKILDLADVQYPEIGRHVGRRKPPKRQIDLLIETAERLGIPPIYAFYNHISVSSRVPVHCASLAPAPHSAMVKSWGISIADAYAVRAVLNDQTFDRHKRHSMALHCLLCSMGSGARPDGGSAELALAGLRRLQILGREVVPVPGYDVPDAPLDRLPAIFEFALELVAADRPMPDDDAMAVAAARFPDVDGVVILQDGG